MLLLLLSRGDAADIGAGATLLLPITTTLLRGVAEGVVPLKALLRGVVPMALLRGEGPLLAVEDALETAALAFMVPEGKYIHIQIFKSEFQNRVSNQGRQSGVPSWCRRGWRPAR